MSSISSIIWSVEIAPGSYSTVAFSVRRFTCAERTPGREARARSTALEQELQVIPVTLSTAFEEVVCSLPVGCGCSGFARGFERTSLTSALNPAAVTASSSRSRLGCPTTSASCWAMLIDSKTTPGTSARAALSFWAFALVSTPITEMSTWLAPGMVGFTLPQQCGAHCSTASQSMSGVMVLPEDRDTSTFLSGCWQGDGKSSVPSDGQVPLGSGPSTVTSRTPFTLSSDCLTTATQRRDDIPRTVSTI
mmetsp:Transcript_1319/g.3812  ORF Transcript_1319/g.3812 Transcript_1319/m.3812 type:complete len:249 (+) Transcript_1319:1145-1891(+)